MLRAMSTPNATKQRHEILLFRKRKAEMAKLRLERFTLEEIGRIYGISKQRVAQILAGTK